MKTSVILLPLFLSLAGATQPSKKIDCQVFGTIPVLKQPKEMDCWITVTTMMLSWKEGKKYTVDEVGKRMGDPWNKYYTTNAGLSEKDQKVFIKKVGLKEEPPANYLLEAYLDFIKKYGPVWITTGDGFSAHARLLIGIVGNGNYDSTNFIFIDPAKGTIVRDSATKFMKEFEAEAYVANDEKWERLRIQIYHF